MKALILGCLMVALSVAARAGEIVVKKIQGDVTVRHGVTEAWTEVAVGDVLRPDDTMKTGKGGSAVLVATVGREKWGDSKTITLPAEVIVDMSDIRELSQEELMLKLTMEKVRASSYQWKNDEMRIPNATVVHGPDRTPATPLSENNIDMGKLQLNGTHVLFDNGFYSTCALKSMELFRLYPTLGEQFENRVLVARALEKADLRGEAFNEYVALSKSENLTPEQREIVNLKIQKLKR